MNVDIADALRILASRQKNPVFANVMNVAAEEITLLRAVLSLGVHMSEAQTTYRKTRRKSALLAARALEEDFLHDARALLRMTP